MAGVVCDLGGEGGEMRKPKFVVGQVVASISAQSGEYMKVISIGTKMARVLGYSGEYAMGLNMLRPLTRREVGLSGGKRK